jgi:hypothetical protein
VECFRRIEAEPLAEGWRTGTGSRGSMPIRKSRFSFLISLIKRLILQFVTSHNFTDLFNSSSRKESRPLSDLRISGCLSMFCSGRAFAGRRAISLRRRIRLRLRSWSAWPVPPSSRPRSEPFELREDDNTLYRVKYRTDLSRFLNHS